MKKFTFALIMAVAATITTLTAFAAAEEYPPCAYSTKETRPLTVAALRNHIYTRLLEDLQTKGLQIVEKSLIIDIQLSDSYYLTVKVVTDLNTGSRLTASGFYTSVAAYTLADEWRPDGSAVNGRCVFFTNRYSRADETRLEFRNSKTGKIVSTVLMDPIMIYTID